ncbi:cytochrome P450 monooxygenase [Aspergillus steynii IBT 23096]|uniref:Cytochrome P450 monooxygenase n=1 Tax=Aspergillus steynii IBT 23096 TaxID=1392250 RepID=A0A2I2GHL2_9EURO|nr:cytochrome P450 monooxygenase [Aspergillus steynii IBT 23096]PLB52327.1 cytochrome P450 monooxygenase [Aspergillus steynii IBT 23096]
MSLTIALVSLLLSTYLLKRLYDKRFKQFAQWPQLKPSLLFGHIGHIQEILSSGPSDRHIDYVFREIHEDLGKPPAFILDLRPVSKPLCVVSGHVLAEQVTNRTKIFPYGLPKTALDSSYSTLLGHRSLFSLQGKEWKRMRQRLNPSFSKNYLLTLMPCILEHIDPLINCLDKCSESGAELALQNPLADLTLDIMISVFMGGNSDDPSESARHRELTLTYGELYSTYSFDLNTPWWFTDPRVRWRRSRIDKRLTILIKDTICKIFDKMTRDVTKGSTVKANPRNTIAWALKDVEHLSAEFLDLLCDQVKFLLFAGFVTTNYLLVWLFYQLSITPRALAAVRHELDETLLVSNAADIFSRMPYVSALVKETLRVYPPGATSRTVPSGSGAFIQIPDGSKVSMDGLSFYSCQTIIHREEEVYGATKDIFLPERWLDPAKASARLKNEQPDLSSLSLGPVPPGAWRPFERGPRTCIGQELALLIPKIVLIFAARRYDFRKVGLGQIARDPNNEPILNSRGQYEVESELYLAKQLVPKPVDKMRMRVSFHHSDYQS